MTDSTPPSRLGSAAGILLAAVAIPSLALNQVLFVGTFSGWMIYGILATLSLLALAGIRTQTREHPVALLIICVTLVSPEALPYSFGVLFFAAALVFTQTGGKRGENAVNHALTALGVWSVILLLRWWLGPVAEAEALRENLQAIAGQNWLPELSPPPPNQPLGHANYTAGLGVLVFPVFAWRAIASEYRARAMLWALFSIIPLGLIFTAGSRAGLLAPGVAVGLWVALAPENRLSVRRKRQIATATVLISLAVISVHPRFHNWLSSPSAQTDSDLIRRDYIVGCWNMFLDRPWTGQGAGSIPLHFPKFAPPDAEQLGCYHAHCTPVQWMAEYGIAGLSIFLVIAWATLTALRASHAAQHRTPLTGFALGASSYLIFSLFDYQTNNPLLGATWGTLLGFCLKFMPERIELAARTTRLLRISAIITTIILCWRIADTAPTRWHVREAQRQPENKDPAAIGHILQATQAGPDEPAVHAIAAMMLGDAARRAHVAKQPALLELADKHWQLADELAPDLPKIKTHRALGIMTQRPAEAEHLLRASLSIAPRQQAAWIALARLTAMRGATDETKEVLALSLLCCPEYYTAPFVRMGRYGLPPAAIKARFVQFTQDYAQEFPKDKRASTLFAQTLRQLDAWDAAQAIPLQVRIGTPPTPEENLMKRVHQDDANGARALRAIIKRHHELDVDEVRVRILLHQYRGDPDTAPFAGARILQTEESWGGFGAYLGYADFINLNSGFHRDDDLLRAATAWSMPIQSARAHRKFFADRLLKPIKPAAKNTSAASH